MARFSSTGGDGSGAPGPQGPAGPAGEDAVLPQDLDTTDSPTFAKIILTNNGTTDNIKIGDDVYLGDGNVANHVVIIGQQDATAGGIVLGTNETEVISTDGENLSISASGNIDLNPGSTSDLLLNAGHDAYLTGGRDVFIESTTDDIHLGSNDDITFGTNINNPLANHSWTLNSEGGLVFPDNTVQTTAFTGVEQGPQGDPGADGADALWNFTGAYNGGAPYAVGDVATYNGQTWYRVNSNGGNVGDTPSEGLWTLIADKGADGAQGPQGDPGTDATGGVVYLGNYISGNGYIADIAVVRGSDNNLYIAKSSGGLGDPVGNTAEWDIFSDNTAGGPGGDLVIPFIMKDENGNDLLGFEKGGTGVTRINALQDDLALRSSNDIILYPGDDGPGNVYIGWGDANYTPDATNRVATIADVEAAAGLGDFVFTAGTATVNDDEILSIQANDPDTVRSQLVLNPGSAQAKLQAFDNPNVTSFYASNPDWDSATWAIEPGIGSVINFVNAPNILNWIATSSLSVYDASMLINGIPVGTVNGFSYNGTDATLYINNTVPTEDPTVNEIGFSFVVSSFIDINYDNGSFDIQANNMDVNIKSDDDVYITAGGDDVHILANDDIRFVSNWNNGGIEQNWRMDSEGRLQFPNNGFIENIQDGSSDGNNNDTFKIVPDLELETDQYLIIEPTFGSPNHLHLRSGGNINESNTDIIIGGEKNSLIVSDTERFVAITSRPPQVINSYVNMNSVDGEYFVALMPVDIQSGYIVNIDGVDLTVSSVEYNSPFEGQMTAIVPGANFISGNNYTFTFNPTWNNTWNFASNGTLYGPAMGGLKVSGIVNDADQDLWISASGADISISATDNVASINAANINITSNNNTTINTLGGDRTWNFTDGGVLYGPAEDSHIEVAGIRGENGHPTMFIGPDSIVLDGNNGEFLNDPTNPANQIATIGNINDTVSTGMVRYFPTFAATGLTFTGSGATHPTYNSYYVKAGKMVTFAIEVDCATVTNFGTGQYKLQLPFTPAIGFNHFSGWANVDTAVNPDVTNGHIILNVDHAGVTDVLDLHYLKQAGGANSGIIEGLFLQGTPVTLTTSSKIYVNGTYISQ